jgi:23S rRNA (cytosine1962-C5)-methyltransferase
MKDDYELLDSGEGRKLEKFGPYLIERPAPVVLWPKSLPEAKWKGAQAVFSREGERLWKKKEVPASWEMTTSGLLFKLSPTDFGHLGIFPEQRAQWEWIQKKSQGLKVLNLFAYSGGSTLAAAKGGASVCHLDASKGMVAWARENAQLNGLEKKPIRWIVEDAVKFLKREQKRGSRYEGIILDPPTFGRGSQGEVFKIEDDLLPLLNLCFSLFSSSPKYVILSCHTPGLTPIILGHLLEPLRKQYEGVIKTGEMTLEGKEGTKNLPSGAFARWSRC